MASYQDSSTRFHDKRTNGIEPSSNNGWIYTAYGKYLRPNLIDMNKIRECFEACKQGDFINRHPGIITPPTSHDEITGLLSLGLIDYEYLKSNELQFCNLPGFKAKSLSEINYIEAAIELYNVKDAHRNAIWKDMKASEEQDKTVIRPYNAGWNLAFILPPQDIYYAKKLQGLTPGIFETLMFYANGYSVIKGGESKGELSVKNKLWLQLKDMKMEGSILYNQLDYVNNFKKYFGSEHAFIKA